MSRGGSEVGFAKYMMGCTEGNFPLPSEPTVEEVHAREQFTAAYRAGPQLPTSQAPLPDYIESRIMYHPKFTPEDKKRCDGEFRSRGFTRITFEWRKPDWTDSDWNSCAADILCDNWGIWVINKRISSNFSFLNTKAALGEWLVGRNADLTQMESKCKKVVTLWTTILRRIRIDTGCTLADSRFRTTLSIFPNHPRLLALMKDPDTVSDYEESEDITILPTTIIPSWRSGQLNTFIRAVDLATVQLAEKEKKASIVRWLSRSNKRRATKKEANYQIIPLGLSFDAFDRDFIENTSVLEHRQLKIVKKDQDFSLREAIVHLHEFTDSSSFSLYM
ncbi:hypothetical protein PSTG_02367 [Puccinia striiformis f. sp. tritici PST-78]|uniref:Uncharacterized protein n=1 Tax=Puccinia striiformis f. sp. tritici PST-78 TaxID=1165861 RepID=A0A0L0VZ07_9BASI|nr:hypothetical protein PSTG_02367 [Puccinia striiformis f. sp. tritici PST-78]